MNSEPDEVAITEVILDTAARMAAVDDDLRARLAGRPALEILDEVTAAVLAAGVETTPEHMLDYAQAISKGEPLSLRLV